MGTGHNNNVIITSKRRRFDVIRTLLLHPVSIEIGVVHLPIYFKIVSPRAIQSVRETPQNINEMIYWYETFFV